MAALVLLAAAVAFGATIESGQQRTVTGTLTSVHAPERSVVVEVPTAKGALTVGVTVPADAAVTLDGKGSSLQALPLDQRARLTYTRTGDRLLAVSLDVFTKP